MSHAFRRGVVALVAAAALGPALGSAGAQEVVRSVPAQTVLETKTGTDFCAVVIFARWKVQPGETGTVRVRSTRLGVPQVDTVKAPYDDIYPFGPLVSEFVAPNGFHQYAMSFGSGSAVGQPADCSQIIAELQRRWVAQRVEVTVNPTCAADERQVNRLRSRLTASRSGHRAALARTTRARKDLRQANSELLAARADERQGGSPAARREVLRAERQRKLAQQRLTRTVNAAAALRRVTAVREKQWRTAVQAAAACRN